MEAVAQKVKDLIADILSALQSAKLYSATHKKFDEGIDRAYKQLQGILLERGELIIGIIGDDFVFESEIYFELAAAPFAQSVIGFLKQKGMEKLIFTARVTRKEFGEFLGLLTRMQKDDLKVNAREQLAYLDIKNIIVDVISSPVSPYEAQKREDSVLFDLYEDYLKKAWDYTEAILNNRPVDYLAVKLNTISLKENLIAMQKFSRLAPLKLHPLPFVAHSVNVTVLAMYFAQKLGLAKDEVLETAIAALFHDIGRMYLSRLPEEQLCERSHGEHGAGLLLGYVETLGQLPVVVSFEHHFRYGLTQPPRLPLSVPYKLHAASLIVAICDAYDSYTLMRSPRLALPPDAIYERMKEKRGVLFDPELFDTFFRVIGRWPIGTIVLLSDGSVGIVRQQNDGDLDRPKVEVRDSPLTRKLIDLRKAEGIFVQKALNPYTDGREYVGMI